jgi:hypothetical protein
MTLSSYSDVFSITHEREDHEDIQPGDIVRTGENVHPRYEVLAVHGAKVWVRDVETGADALALLSRCRKMAAPIRLAAE